MSVSWESNVLGTQQNAISTLLQPPIVRTGLLPHTSAPASSSHKPPTIRDIPPVTLTNISHVDAAEFSSYLAHVSALHEQLRKLRETQDEAANILHKRGGKPGESAAVLNDSNLRPEDLRSASRNSSVSSVSSFIDASSPIRRPSSGPLPLSTIPIVYFDEDFHLENPRTFDVVSERSEVVRPPLEKLAEKGSVKGVAAAPRKAFSTNAILQEKLSWYMDTIEMHLLASITTASATFFAALGSLQDLRLGAADSVKEIKALRKELLTLDRDVAASGLIVVQKRQRQQNVQQLHSSVLQLRYIIDGVATCESFVDNGEVEKALESIDALDKFIAGDSDISNMPFKIDEWNLCLRDLRGTTAIQGVNYDLNILRLQIGKTYETRFLGLLMGDLRCHSAAVSTQEVLRRWVSASVRLRGGHTQEPSVFPSYMSSTDGLRSQLLENLTGLQKTNHVIAAVAAYREAALNETRNLVRRLLPSSSDDDNESINSSSTTRRQLSQQQKSSILARNLRALEPKDAEELLVKIYIGITETLRRLTTQVKLLLDVVSLLDNDCDSRLRSSQMESPQISPTNWRHSSAAIEIQEIHKAIDLPDLLGQAVDVAQDKIVKLLRVRSEQSTHLSLIRFLRYFTLNLYFANECETISGRSGTTLKTVVNGQIKDFVQQHGDMEKQKLARGMESDLWEAKEFSEKDTVQLNRILSSSTKDPAEWSDGLRLWMPYSDGSLGSESKGAVDLHPSADGKVKTRTASINEETFVLPTSAILCMDGLAHFLQLIVGIPSMTSDIGASLVSYLQQFNSHCAQLILGAGARQSAGLKNITSKHLVLASQALAFIAALINYVHECVKRHARSGAASSVADFDMVKRLFQEHQNSIYDKLIEMMSRLASSHVKTVINIDWHSSLKTVHPYMAALVKDTTSLHRTLIKVLPVGTVRILMAQVFSNYKDHFGKAFQEVDPKTESGRDSMLRDIEYFESKLGRLDGYSDNGEYLTTIIKSKQVKSVAPATSTAAELIKKDIADSTKTKDNS